MDALLWSRVLHVLGVVIWIGGVSFVTLILLPASIRRPGASEQSRLFASAESSFAWWARGATLITGLTGFYMLYLTNGWSRFARPDQWWLYAMVTIWAIFTLMLFVVEPLLLHRWVRANVKRDPAGTMRRLHRAHLVLLTLSLITIAGAVAGSHGGNLFGS
ncbi:MAG: hypothetical protein ABI351_08715 [Herbaspirillum sp.]